MKNLVVVGDSFCMYPLGWPQQLADSLNLRLLNRGVGGEHWWGTRQYLANMSDFDKNETEAIVFCHTYSGRIPCEDPELGKFDISNLDCNDEKQQAVKLYYKYIQSPEFLEWAQKAWFREISSTYQSIKLINLHGFPWSLNFSNELAGVNVVTNLSALSLNEIAAQDLGELAGDSRPNHFNDYNNKVLAAQLCDIINNYTPGDVELNVNEFDLKTQTWFDWK